MNQPFVPRCAYLILSLSLVAFGGCSSEPPVTAHVEPPKSKISIIPAESPALQDSEASRSVTSESATASSANDEVAALNEMAEQLVSLSHSDPNEANAKLQVLFSAADKDPDRYADVADRMASRMLSRASEETAEFARNYQILADYRDHGFSPTLTKDLAEFACKFPKSERPMNAYKAITRQLVTAGDGTTALSLLQHGIKHCAAHRDVESLQKLRKMTVQTISLLGSTRVTSHVRRPFRNSVRETRTPKDSKYFHLVGQRVSIDGTTLQGSAVSAGRLRGDWVFVHFWATWCGACRSSIPGMVLYEQEYAELGVKFVGVNMDKDKKLARDYIEKQEITWPQIESSGGGGWDTPLAKTLAIKSIPTCLLVSPDGKIVEAGRSGAVAKAIRHHLRK